MGKGGCNPTYPLLLNNLTKSHFCQCGVFKPPPLPPFGGVGCGKGINLSCNPSLKISWICHRSIDSIFHLFSLIIWSCPVIALYAKLYRILLGVSVTWKFLEMLVCSTKHEAGNDDVYTCMYLQYTKIYNLKICFDTMEREKLRGGYFSISLQFSGMLASLMDTYNKLFETDFSPVYQIDSLLPINLSKRWTDQAPTQRFIILKCRVMLSREEERTSC